jgi:replication factor A1
VNSFLSTVQAIIVDILSKRRDLSEDHILALIEEKKKEGRGLLSDEGAARLVAEELLIQTRGSELGRMQVKNLVSGLNDVSISGRVLLVWPPQQFQRRDGTPGRVMRLILVDKSGRVRCALWDRHVDVASRTGNLQGKVVRIGHAYTRQGLTDEPEVHAGDRSSIEIDPQDIPSTDFPEFKDLFTQLGDLTTASNQVNAVGIVDSEPRHYTFSKENRTGSVLHMILADQSGTIPVVAWNEKAEELRELKKGSILQIINARTKLDSNSRPELHIETRSQASILSSTPDFLKAPVPRKFRIAELTGQVGSVDLTVSVITKGEPREVKRRTSDETVKVSTIVVADETGIASLSLWDDKAALVSQVQEGGMIELYGVSVRENLGELRLSLTSSSRLENSPTEKKIVPPVTKLNALNTSKGLIIVEGAIIDEPLARQVVTGRGENVSVASFTIQDDTGSTKVSVWREQVASVMKLRPGTRLRIMGLRVRPGLGQLELSSIPLTKIELIEEPIKERPAWEDIRHVIALELGLSTWIKGVVLEVGDSSTVSALCETCGSELAVVQNQFFCQHCNSEKSGKIVLTGRLKIDDGTGVADVTLSGQDAATLTTLDLQKIREFTLKEGKGTRNLPQEELLGLVGKEIEVYGTAEAGAAEGKFDLMAKKLVLVPKL